MIDQFLPKNALLRSAIRPLVALVAVLVITQLVMPGTGGNRGTPFAIIYRGVVLGLVSALTATGIILVYRTIRVINFAQATIGAAGGTLTFLFIQFTKVPFVVSFVLGLALSTLLGFAIGILALRFNRAPRLVLTVFTIVLVQALGLLVPLIRNLPIFPRVEELSIFEQLGEGAFRNRLPLAGWSYQIGSLPISFGYAEVFAIEVSVVALLAVGAFFRYTRAGVAVRAMAENSERATLLGIGTGLLSCIVWALSGLLSGVGVTLTGALQSPAVATSGGIGVLLAALAAGVLGRMKSLPATAGAAVAISVLAEAWAWSFKDDIALFDVGLFLLVAIGLLVQRRELMRSEQTSETSSWAATQEIRPVPRELLAIPSLRVIRWAIALVGIAVVGIYPYAVGTGATNLGAVIAINAIIVVSLVVLTGWAGQVSLGQFAFAALGAVIGGALTSRVGLMFWLAVPLTSIVVAGLAALIGLPALRIRGLFLLVVTFAFAISVQRVLFNERYFGWLLPDTVERPTFFLIDFDDERSMYYLCVLALVAAILFVSRMRRTRIARILIASRENEANARSFAVGVVRAKLMAFAISGGLAGFAGVLFAHQQRGLSAESFTAQAGIDVFIQAVFGGISAVSGALLGSSYFNLTRYFSSWPPFLLIAGPLATLTLLFVAPGGLISLVIRVRDGILKIIAQRRQIIVPSLFADIDPEALEARLWPLSDPLPSAGLAALPNAPKFTVASELYGEDGLLASSVLTQDDRSLEADVIEAAATAEAAQETPALERAGRDR